MKPKKVKAEDCVNGNCEICELAEMPLDHKLMNAFQEGGMGAVAKEIQAREEEKRNALEKKA